MSIKFNHRTGLIETTGDSGIVIDDAGSGESLTIRSDGTDIFMEVEGASADLTLHRVGSGSMGNFNVLATINVTGDVNTNASAGASIKNETASATNPTLIPRRDDVTSGIGAGATGQLSLIANSEEMMNLNQSTSVIDFNDGAGTQILFDMANDVSTFTGVIEILEQADHATSPTSGRGQIWVKTGALGGELMYTEGDQDKDFTVYNVIESTYHFSQTTTSADPGAGNIRWSSNTPASVTNIYIDDLDETGRDAQFMLGNLADGDILNMRTMQDSTDYMVASVNGSPTDNVGWWTIPVTIIHSGGLPSTGDPMHITVEWQSQAAGGAGTVTSVSAGDGLDFTTITATGAVTMGTPGTLTNNTTNAVTATSHTHAITTSGTGTILSNSGPTLVGATIHASGSFRFVDSVELKFGSSDDVVIDWDGTDLEIVGLASNQTINFRDGYHLVLWDSTDTDNVDFHHDGVDFNIVGTTTTDINITGITAIAAGTVDADFDAITATSYGGITEANLLDKTATETVSGAWTITTGLIIDTDVASAALTIGDGTSTSGDILLNFNMDRAWSFISDSDDASNRLVLRSVAGGGKTFAIQDDSSVDQLTVATSTGAVAVTGALTAASYGGITEANLLDKSSAETVTGTWILSGAVTAADFGTGGKVADGTDVNRPIGFNVIPVYEIDVADTFDLAHNGMLWHKDAGGTISFTCDNDGDIPQGASYMVHNDDTEDVTIAEGTATIEFLSPGAAPVGGDVTVEQGGIVTVYKYSDTVFWVWGAKAAAAAANVTVADESADTTCFPLFVTAATGDLPPKSGTNLTFNSSTGDLSATLIAGITAANLVDKAAAEIITGVWHFGGIDLDDNAQLRIGTSNDVIIDWDGTDMEIVGAASNQVWNFRDGANIRLYDSGDTDYMGMRHNGTDAYTEYLSTTWHRFDGIGSGWLWLDGGEHRIYDSTNADYMLLDTVLNEARINTNTGTALRIDTNAGGTCILCASAGAVSLYHNNGLELRTQQHELGGITSGAEVYDSGGTFHDLGFNDLTVFNDNVSDTLESRHCGRVAFKDSSTVRTLTLEASGGSDFPIGGMTTVINAFTSGNYTIADGATALYYLDGTTRTDVGASCTVGPGGVANIWREAAGVYYIWGTGITI